MSAAEVRSSRGCGRRLRLPRRGEAGGWPGRPGPAGRRAGRGASAWRGALGLPAPAPGASARPAGPGSPSRGACPEGVFVRSAHGQAALGRSTRRPSGETPERAEPPAARVGSGGRLGEARSLRPRRGCSLRPRRGCGALRSGREAAAGTGPRGLLRRGEGWGGPERSRGKWRFARAGRRGRAMDAAGAAVRDLELGAWSAPALTATGTRRPAWRDLQWAAEGGAGKDILCFSPVTLHAG